MGTMTKRDRATSSSVPLDPVRSLRAALLLGVRWGNRLPGLDGAARLRRLRSPAAAERAATGWSYALVWTGRDDVSWQARIGIRPLDRAGAAFALSARLTTGEAPQPFPRLTLQCRLRQDGALAMTGEQAEALALAGLLAAVTDDTEGLVDLLQDKRLRLARIRFALRLTFAPEGAARPWSLLVAGDFAATGGPALKARLRGPGIASIRGECIEWNRQGGDRSGPAREHAPEDRRPEGDRHGVATAASV